MSIMVFSDRPEQLLSEIRSQIDQNRIRTWEYDKDGDFSHTGGQGQWKDRAWLSPSVVTGGLELIILPPKNTTLEPDVLGIYFGRFIEMLFTHFSNHFTSVTATP